jgi:hypothetical protein
MAEKLVGLYFGAQTVLDDPGYVDALQKDAGLNLLLMGGPFNLSQELRDTAPYVTPTGREGAGFGWSDDDSVLRKALEECRKRGIKTWVVIGGWHGGGENRPDYCVRDLWGRPLSEVPAPRCALEKGLSVCPSRPEINGWMERAAAEVARGYDVDAIDITHGRNTAPAYIPAWWSCACPHCQRRAAKMGYDMGRMRNSVDTFLARLSHLTPRQVKLAAQAQPGMFGLFQFLGVGGGIVDWFNFRADVISDNLRGITRAVHEATPKHVQFGSDNQPPSFSLLAGHRYTDFVAGATDFTQTLISHVAFFVYATLASFADLVMNSVAGVDEADALQLSYSVFGYENFGMPKEIAGFHLGNWDLEEASSPIANLVEKELTLARALNPGNMPSIPVIKGTLWSKETIRRLIDSTFAMGHDGIIFQGTSAITSYQPKS